MNLVFLDLEYNQTKNLEDNKIIPFEIIEFACIVTDFNLKTISELNCLIKPEFQMEVDGYIHQLTGIRTVDIQNRGIQFNNCMDRFKQICSNNFHIITWGNEDLRILKQNCLAKNYNIDFFKNAIHINAQKSYQIIKKLKNEISLQKIKKELNIPSAKEHRAYYDVLDLISICKEIGISNVLSQKEARVCYENTKEGQKQKMIDFKLQKAVDVRNENDKCFDCKSSNIEVLKDIKPCFDKSTNTVRSVRLLKCKECGSISFLSANFGVKKELENNYISKKIYKKDNPNCKHKIKDIMNINFNN